MKKTGSTSGSEPVPRHRNDAIDASRGLIVALMALDHVRIFFTAAQFDPTDLDSTNMGYFFARWVTHLCAPGFFFIAGMGAALLEQRASKREVTTFLLARGAWLVALEVLVFGFAWSFNPGWWWFGVISGLWASMILLAGLIHFPRLVLIVAAGLFTLLHADLSPMVLGDEAPGSLLRLSYTGGPVDVGFLGRHLVIYPVLPWAALMVLGYASARWLMEGSSVRSARALQAGGGAILLFVLLRFLGLGELHNSFDPSGEIERDIMSFLDVQKYPPTLQFSLVTLGIGLVALALFNRASAAVTPWLRPLVTFGRVPFFFYCLHLFLIHGLALATALAAGWPTGHSFWTRTGPNLIPPDGYGIGLGGVCAVWLAVLALLYPACVWFAEVKRRHPSWWIRYL